MNKKKPDPEKKNLKPGSAKENLGVSVGGNPRLYKPERKKPEPPEKADK